MNANEFIEFLRDELSLLAKDGRSTFAEFNKGFVAGPSNGTVYVNFVNLPLDRFHQRRGGGAESENNRQLFSVKGFSSNPFVPVAKVTVEHMVNNILGTPRLRKKTASPDRAAAYLAGYISQVAAQNEPNLTHD